MDDLDALLADLHTTSQQYSHSTGGPRPSNNAGQHYQYHYSQQVGDVNYNYDQRPNSFGSQSGSDGYASLDNMNQPIYEPQNVNRQMTTTTVTKTTRYHNSAPPAQHNQSEQRYHTPPPYRNQSERYQTPPRSQTDVEFRYEGAERGPHDQDGAGRVSLRSNLSELDNMLEDLNSAQFLNEVDKRSRAHSPYANLSSRPTPPPKPYESRDVRDGRGSSLSDVDRMLTDLEREAERNRENAQHGYRYEQRTQTTTTYNGPSHVTRTALVSPSSDQQQFFVASPTDNRQQYVATSSETRQQFVSPPGDSNGYLVSPNDNRQQYVATSSESRQQYVAPSNATRELDDLMASLSEFNMKPLPAGPAPPPQSPAMQRPRVEGTPPPAPVSDPPYAVANKPSRMMQQSRTVTTTTRHDSPTPPSPSLRRTSDSPVRRTADSPGPGDSSGRESVTRFDTPVRNLVPDVQVQTSSYANVSVDRGTYDGDVRRYGGDDGDVRRYVTDERHQYVNASGDQADGRRDRLDAMMGQLDSDMQRHGVTTVAKGHCAACNKPIVGQVITALGRIWHPEHFCCAHCHNELGTMTFFERDGRPYCEEDYHALFSPRCAGCNGPILDRCVTGLGQTWHPEHFCCAHCGRPFDDEGFHEKEGKPYCREDYFDMFAPKCGGCRQPIVDNYISALNKQWHPECFICQDCHMPFSGGSFYDHDGLPFCETHYHAKRGSLCAGCNKPITGRCITAMYRKFHPEHFVCAFCLKQLNKGTFKEQNDKPYCHSCFVKLFG